MTTRPVVPLAGTLFAFFAPAADAAGVTLTDCGAPPVVAVGRATGWTCAPTTWSYSVRSGPFPARGAS